MNNPLLALQALGQSIWLDFISRGMIAGGELTRLIQADGLRGVTSNPAIFEKAIVGSPDYEPLIRSLAQTGEDVQNIYRTLTVDDIQQAADCFSRVFEETRGKDGYVSLEVSPYLAHDTDATIAEARELWRAVARPNVLIKVPGTKAGLPAIRQLIGDGINVNVTLLFSVERYREVADAYLAGLEQRVERGDSVNQVTSVASFFLSRIDTLVDSLLDPWLQRDNAQASLAKALHGEVAIASAKVAYYTAADIYTAERYRKLAAAGGRPQRLLWASTSTKNPAYSDVKYVDALIGPDTINTVPLETLEAYRDHGRPEIRINDAGDQAANTLKRLADLNIDLAAVTQQLEDEGVEKFIQPFAKLLKTLEKQIGASK